MQLLDIEGASKHLRLSIPTLYRYTSQKRIPFYKVGGKILFNPEKLDEWISGFAVEPTREVCPHGR